MSARANWRRVERQRDRLIQHALSGHLTAQLGPGRARLRQLQRDLQDERLRKKCLRMVGAEKSGLSTRQLLAQRDRLRQDRAGREREEARLLARTGVVT